MNTEKRYQVFVSSTFVDLKKEREEVIQVLLEMDCMPSGMELFPATDDAQWELIRQVIDDCDYYVLIIGGRYGSLGPGGLSYTEMEYRYAIDSGKPTIAFLHGNPGSIAADKTENSEEGRLKLAEFRALAEKKLCRKWETPAELGSVMGRSLQQLMKKKPGIGWVRANAISSPETNAELLLLRRKVDELQAKLTEARTSEPDSAKGLAKGSERFRIDFWFQVSDPDDMDFEDHTVGSHFQPTWDEIFGGIAPKLLDEVAEDVMRTALNEWIDFQNYDALLSKPEYAGRSVDEFSVVDEDFQTIKIQFKALGLVKRQGTRWSLTPYGEDTLTHVRAVRSKTLFPDD